MWNARTRKLFYKEKTITIAYDVMEHSCYATNALSLTWSYKYVCKNCHALHQKNLYTFDTMLKLNTKL